MDGALTRRPSLRGPLGRMLAPLMALFVLAQVSPALGQSNETWVPTGYEEHARAAWAITALLCGPDIPDRYAGTPELQEMCADTYAAGLLWLGMALAWTQLPSSGGGGDLQVFPELDPEVMARLRPLAASARPTWRIVADENLVRAPEPIRQQLMDTATRNYGVQIRITMARALIDNPDLDLLYEPPPLSGPNDTSDLDAPDWQDSGRSSSASAAPAGSGGRQEPEPADSAASDAVESAVPGTTGAGDPNPALVAACVEQTNMGEALCTCVARKAREELSEKEHAFLLATVREDEEETERLRGELSVQEAMRAGMFLVNAPRECAGG